LHFFYKAERLILLDLHVGAFLWFCSGLNVFQAFTSYLKVKNPDDKSKDELLKELAALDEHLHAHVRPKNTPQIAHRLQLTRTDGLMELFHIELCMYYRA